MAPLICRVVDIKEIGVEGVRVFLECRDRYYKCMARLDSVTGEDGWICAWLPTTPGLDIKIEPQIMDTADFPGVSMTFISPSLATVPFLSVRADLYLAGVACHGVLLRLETSPRLEYITHSTANSAPRQPRIAPQGQILQAPSPLQLPQSVLASNDRSVIGDEGIAGIAAEKLFGQKRKLEWVEEELGVARRRLA